MKLDAADIGSIRRCGSDSDSSDRGMLRGMHSGCAEENIGTRLLSV
jgi:hypothetical protein